MRCSPHPLAPLYTAGLMAATPHFAPGRSRTRREPLAEIAGTVPSLLAPPPGCRFAQRCAIAIDRSRAERPPLVEHRPSHWAACWRAGETQTSGHG